ncbi:MAG: tetratricopeptide repeat protein, partial [Planctomycetota bacterium]
DKTDQAQEQLDQIPEEEVLRRPRCLSIRGRLLLGQGKPWEAIGALERCVRAAPGSGEGYMFLGMAFSSVGERGTALACFREACARAPGNEHYQLQLARAEFALGHYGSTIQRCRRLVVGDVEPDTETEARLLLAQAYATLRDTDNASQAVRAAADAVQDDVAHLIRLAALYVSQKNFARAEELLRGFIAKHEDSAAAVSVLAQTLVLQQKTAEAQKLLEAFVAEHKDSLPAVSALAQVYVLRDKSKEAEEVLQGAMKASDEPLAPTVQYARMCLARGDKDSAKVSLRGLLESAPQRLDYQRAMAGFYVATGEMDQALQTYKEAEKTNPDDLAVKYAIFSLLLPQQRFDEAEAYAEQITQREPHSTRALLVRPRLLLAKGELEEAISALNEVVDRRPHEPAPHQLLGRAYAASGDLSSAVQHLKGAVAISPRSTRARLLLAEAYYRSKLFALAIRETREIVQTNPSSQPAHLLAAYSLTAERAVEEAIEEWNAALGLGEGRVTHYVALGRLHLEKDELDKAEQAFTKAHELDPTSPVVVQALAHLYRVQGKPAQGEALLKELVDGDTEGPVGHLLLGNHYHATGDVEAAEEQFAEAIAASPKSPGCHVVLGNFHFVTGKTEEAIADYRPAMELSEKPGDARLLLVRALVAARRLEEAEELIDTALNEDPNDYRALVQQAQIMLPRAYHHRDNAAVQEAIHRCQRALQQKPDYAEAHYVIGKAHLSRVPPQLLPAESEYRRALQIAPHDVRIRIEHAKVLFLLGRHADADKEAREVLRTQPSNFPALVVLADASLGSADRKPEAVAKKLAREFPTNPAAEFLLGRTHHRSGRFEEALAHYQRAFAQERHAFVILDGLVGCSLALEKPEQAVAFCEEFITHNPRSVVAHEMLGNVYLKDERFADAEKALRRAARLNPASLDPVLALLGVYRKQEKPDLALRACRSYVERWPKNPAGHILLGRLLAQQERIDDARAAFAKALELNPRSFRALRLLVRTHVTANNPDAAVARCQDFIRQNPG